MWTKARGKERHKREQEKGRERELGQNERNERETKNGTQIETTSG